MHLDVRLVKVFPTAITHTLILHRFLGKEFASVTVEEGVEERILGVLRPHPQYSCVERIAELHPQLKEGEEGEEVS